MSAALTTGLLLLSVLACRDKAAPGDIVDNVLIRVNDQGRNPELRWGMTRSALPEVVKGPAEAPLPVPDEAALPEVECVELAGAGLVSIPVRFDRTFVCFYRDRVYLRGAWRRIEGDNAKHECTSMVEGMSQEYGVGVLPLVLDTCVQRYEGQGRSAHCERKVRRAAGDDRVGHSVQVEHFGPPRTRIELEEKLFMHASDLYMEARALRVEPKSGSPWCELSVIMAEPELQAASLAWAEELRQAEDAVEQQEEEAAGEEP